MAGQFTGTVDARPFPMNSPSLAGGSRKWCRRALPTLAAALVIGATLRLGFWQLDRTRQREVTEAQLNAVRTQPPIVLGEARVDGKTHEFHPAQVQGEWVPEKTIFLDNQIHQGQVGFDVLMPIRLANANINVLVDRGWVAGSGDRSRLPNIVTPQGTQRITGLVRERTPRVGSVGIGARNGAVWSEVTPADFAVWSGLSVQPLVLYQTSMAEDGLIRDWPSPGSGADRNRGYAVQWFAMALVTAALWGYYSFRGKKENDKVT